MDYPRTHTITKTKRGLMAWASAKECNDEEIAEAMSNARAKTMARKQRRTFVLQARSNAVTYSDSEEDTEEESEDSNQGEASKELYAELTQQIPFAPSRGEGLSKG